MFRFGMWRKKIRLVEVIYIGAHENAHTETVELRFIGPAAKAAQAANALEDLGFVNRSDSIPRREAFPEYEAHEFPGALLSGASLRAELTQGQLSELTGIPQGHISEMEHGKRPIGQKTILKLRTPSNWVLLSHAARIMS